MWLFIIYDMLVLLVTIINGISMRTLERFLFNKKATSDFLNEKLFLQKQRSEA